MRAGRNPFSSRKRVSEGQDTEAGCKMQLGKVIGTVVATQKHEALAGVKLLIVQPITPDGRPKGRPVVAADGTAMAGPGETVFVIASREGALVLEKWFTPVDHGIVGIVDQIYVAPGALPRTPDKDQHKATKTPRHKGKR
jgi:ethanolamine utilization protein EutN